MSVTQQISDFVTKTQIGEIPARHIAKLSLLDWAAVTVAGKNEPVTKIVRELAAEECGAKQAYAVGIETFIPARMAALVNGTTSHVLDYDDTHFAYVGHPSVAVFPAVLAIADKIGSDINSTIDAALIGLETATRVGIWLGRLHYRRGFHITATAGTFGAAAGCAKLLGLTEDQTHMALSLAASKASGIKEQFGTMGKPFHAGIAASSGVEACLLAQKGFVAGINAFDGVQGFGVTHASEENAEAFQNLGSKWIFEDVSHKFHACCHGTHAMLEALELITGESSFDLSHVQSIEVKTHPQYLNVCNIQSPVSGLEAKFSYRLLAALGLSDIDTASPNSFTDDICKAPELVALRDITHVVTDESLSESRAIVKVTLAGGNKLEASYDLLDLKTPKERETKVRAKARSLLGGEKEKELWNTINHDKRVDSKYSVTQALLA